LKLTHLVCDRADSRLPLAGTEEKGIGKKKAIVGIARRLGVLLYTLMKHGRSYEVRHFRGGKKKADTEALAREAISA
jgi:hypothetical protein